MREEQRETDRIPLGLPFITATAISHSGLTQDPSSVPAEPRWCFLRKPWAVPAGSQLADTILSFWSPKLASNVLGWQSYFPSCRFCHDMPCQTVLCP